MSWLAWAVFSFCFMLSSMPEADQRRRNFRLTSFTWKKMNKNKRKILYLLFEPLIRPPLSKIVVCHTKMMSITCYRCCCWQAVHCQSLSKAHSSRNQLVLVFQAGKYVAQQSFVLKRFRCVFESYFYNEFSQIYFR